MTGSDRPEPCLAYPAALHYPDVDPDVLAREAADEAPEDAFPWPTYLRRTLERQPGVGDG